MITVKHICDALEAFAPLTLQENYDNCGLQVGDYNMKVTSILLSTDITEEILEEAIIRDCNMIIIHHPLIFRSLKQITNQTYIERIVIRAIKNNIAIYAAHTNFDKVKNGVSFRMAKKIGLTSVDILRKDQTDNTGLGCIGMLPAPIKTAEFIENIKKVFGVTAIKHTAIISDKVQTIALCGGSGADLINDAINKDADIYLTADISYHSYFNTQNKIIIADIGHHESEKFTKEIFYEQLTNFFPNFAVQVSNLDISPVLWS